MQRGIIEQELVSKLAIDIKFVTSLIREHLDRSLSALMLRSNIRRSL